MSEKIPKSMEGTSYWCFAIINGRLGEIFFKKGMSTKHVLAHCYHKKGEVRTLREKKMIKEDIKNHQFSFRKGKYRRVNIPV